MPFDFKESVMLHVDQCHPRTWNPNVMSPEKFNQFAEKVADEGFTDGIKVSPVPPEEVDKSWSVFDQHYWIWAGEHRWRLCKTEGMEEVPAFVYEGEEWDTNAQKLKMVRDNLVHGELDDKKFTELVRSLDQRFDVDHRLLGFEDQAEMMKHLIIEKNKADNTFLDGYLNSANQKQEAVQSLSDIVANIFVQTAATVDQSYLFFTYKGATACVVLCKKPTFDEVTKLVTHLTETGADINDFMVKAIQNELPPPAP